MSAPAYSVVKAPDYGEPMDPQIVPLCDALNDAGFTTLSSCCGHRVNWPHVFFSTTDSCAEALARHLLKVGETSTWGSWRFQAHPGSRFLLGARNCPARGLSRHGGCRVRGSNRSGDR